MTTTNCRLRSFRHLYLEAEIDVWHRLMNGTSAQDVYFYVGHEYHWLEAV